MRQKNGMPDLPSSTAILHFQETTMKTTNVTFRRMLAITIFTGLASSAASVCSAAEGDVLQVKVQYADLNLSGSQGASKLYSRIRMAAEEVCHPLRSDDLWSKKVYNSCLSAAIANAVNKVDQPSLFSVYNAKTSAAKPIVLASSQSR
jgi:UrcA family protein